MVVRFVTTKLVPAATTLGVAVTVYCSSASAFFPPILGSDPPVVVVPPVTNPQLPTPVVPPVIPPPFIPPTVPTVPVVPNEHCPPTPHEVPEPATMAMALIGLGVAGAAGLRKAMKKKTDEPKA